MVYHENKALLHTSGSRTPVTEPKETGVCNFFYRLFVNEHFYMENLSVSTIPVSKGHGRNSTPSSSRQGLMYVLGLRNVLRSLLSFYLVLSVCTVDSNVESATPCYDKRR